MKIITSKFKIFNNWPWVKEERFDSLFGEIILKKTRYGQITQRNRIADSIMDSQNICTKIKYIEEKNEEKIQLNNEKD